MSKRPPVQRRRVVYFPDAEWERLKVLARYRKVSISEALRQLLRDATGGNE